MSIQSIPHNGTDNKETYLKNATQKIALTNQRLADANLPFQGRQDYLFRLDMVVPAI